MTAGASIRISLVEDEATIRDALTGLFTSEPGVELVRAYRNAEEAIEGLPEDAPDVVVMDISMPGMSGIECVKHVIAQLPATQFLMYTMHDDDHQVFEALKAGAHGYLLKSSTPDQIIDAVHELMNGGAPMSTAVARRVIGHFRPIQERSDNSKDKLSEREYGVLQLLAEGLLYKEIADRLGLTVGTVKQHIHRMYAKMHVQNRVEAVNRYFGR
ncbi:MAG: response regulator transcription factor [Flavobacteriales bacterium]|nr:response regulator transcription factor [Flavobacteriales bacterium]